MRISENTCRGGFFIYKAEGKGELLYANHAVFDIYDCDGLEDFKELTGYTFKGMVHPDDYAAVSQSIDDQIEESDENIDHVVYRITRKDGEVRWVDDYGHYAESENMGGLYYVFISDITEKHVEEEKTQVAMEATQRENLLLMDQMESAAGLADLMGSVASLLSNMPAMSFSKEVSTRRYLACNQAFAEYAGKNSPDEVVGHTDHELFDKETADHFVEDDAKAVAMDEPYVFFEDVPDASGSITRNLQTTKLKFTDNTGRLCTLGMFVDVTEISRMKESETRQREMEERIARKNGMNHVARKRRAELSGRHMLMAEDIKVNAEIMKKILEVKGIYVEHAENGKIALNMFAGSEEGHFDAILMDVRMPEMDGLEAAAAIRALNRADAGAVPIIALTANAFDEDVQRSLQVGMNAHLSKPVDPDHLYSTLEELIWEAENR